MLAKCQAMHNISYSTRTHSAHVSTSLYDNKHSRGVCVCVHMETYAERALSTVANHNIQLALCEYVV